MRSRNQKKAMYSCHVALFFIFPAALVAAGAFGPSSSALLGRAILDSRANFRQQQQQIVALRGGARTPPSQAPKKSKARGSLGQTKEKDSSKNTSVRQDISKDNEPVVSLT
jgi:hypothetical protein